MMGGSNYPTYVYIHVQATMWKRMLSGLCLGKLGDRGMSPPEGMCAYLPTKGFIFLLRKN